MKYTALLLGCAVAGVLTGHLLHKPPSPPAASLSAAVGTPAPAAPASTDQAVTELLRLLGEVARPGLDSVEAEGVLCDRIEHFSSVHLAALANSLAGQTDNRLKNLTGPLIGYWAEKDPAAAREWVLKREDAVGPLLELAATWAKMDPRGYADWLATLRPEEMGKNERQLLLRFIDNAGSEHPDRALALVSGLRDLREREGAFSALFAAWAKRDPASASGRVLQLETSASKAKGVEAVAAAWAEKDARAAWTWIGTIPDAVLSMKAQHAFIDGLAKADPGAAAARVAELPLTQESTALLKKLATEWSRKDPEAAAKWAVKIDDTTMRQEVSQSIQMGATSGEFEAATRFLIQHAEEMEPSRMALQMMMQRASRRYGANIGEYIARFPEKYRVDAVLAAAHTVKATHPNFVEDWAMSQPEGETRSRLFAQLADMKNGRDSADAVVWVKALPEGPSKQSAAASLVRLVYDHSPERSVEILRTLTPADALPEKMHALLHRWLTEAPVSARKWIESTDTLTAGQKRALFETN
jgi:hypothetical protein